MAHAINFSFPGLDLSFTELGDFMSISTCGHAAPLPAMIFGRVVKIEHARGRIGAPVDIIEISLGQKTGNLVGDQVKGKLFAVEMGPRASGEEINQSLKKIVDELASRDPLNQSIATAVVTATLSVAPNKDDPWENTHEMGSGAVVGMGNGSNPVLIATCRDSDVSVNPDGSGIVTVTCQAAPASVNFGSPVSALRQTQYLQVNCDKATLPPNTLITGGWIIWTINSAITLKFPITQQIAATGFQGTGQVTIRDVADGLKPLSSVPDKSAP